MRVVHLPCGSTTRAARRTGVGSTPRATDSATRLLAAKFGVSRQARRSGFGPLGFIREAAWSRPGAGRAAETIRGGVADLGVPFLEEQREAGQSLCPGVDAPEGVARGEPEPGPPLDRLAQPPLADDAEVGDVVAP